MNKAYLAIPILLLFFTQSCLRLDNSSNKTNTTVASGIKEQGHLWTFDNPPLTHLEKTYDFKPEQEWLNALRLGALRLEVENKGPIFGSASFVSPNGLILTSNRSIVSAVARTLDSKGYARDGEPLKIIKTGFAAKSLEQEIRLRVSHDDWLTATQLVNIVDVTDEVNLGVEATDDEVLAMEKREANKQITLEVISKASPELESEIVSLYQGAVYHLYQYKVYKDIRLVCMPHLQIAQFGGDQDNFNYPRHSLDFAFLRAYEEGQPVNSSNYFFKWKKGGASENKLVFVTGNPGKTHRFLTKTQLELEMDIKLLMEIDRLTSELRILKDPGSNTYTGEFDPENPSRHWAWVRTSMLNLENDLKVENGKLDALEDKQLMAKKTAIEQTLRQCLMADKQLTEKYNGLFDEMTNLVEQLKVHEVRMQFHKGAGLLDLVMDIVRLSDPEATVEHRKYARDHLDGWTGHSYNLNFHGVAHVLDHFVRASQWLPADDPYMTKVLGDLSPKGFVEILEERSSTWLGHSGNRDALIELGWKGILESKDPLVIAARELVVLMRENEQLGGWLEAKEEALGLKMAQAMFACYGANIGPDGTGTLRFSDGVVSGYVQGDADITHYTTFGELYARNIDNVNRYPFTLPEVWLDRKSEIDMSKPLNFVCTNDVASSGSTGSVIVNKELEVIGLVIDGNANALYNHYLFDDEVGRCVSVHVEGILEALEKVYGADRVVEELDLR
ncbi:MAG: S46 family peptidase [Bacteroidota bacterium]